MEMSKGKYKATLERIDLSGTNVVFRLTRPTSAKKLLVRVGPSGVQVTAPRDRTRRDIFSFLTSNEKWLLEQLDRIRALNHKSVFNKVGPQTVLYRGNPVQICIVPVNGGKLNRVYFDGRVIVLKHGTASRTRPEVSLVRWLKSQTRELVESELSTVLKTIRKDANRIYIRGQRTKWGNCSSIGNLSFNWRLIFAPETVLRYIVVHEATHLAIPDHSRKFWLTVKSLCPDTERARQWLAANGRSILDYRVCSNEKSVGFLSPPSEISKIH
jgi:predicted metal-dependent hydrolase